MGLEAAARMQRFLATVSTRSLLGLLIALSLGIFVFEVVHVTWSSQAIRGVRHRMNTKLFHVPGSESKAFEQQEVVDEGRKNEVDPSDLLHVGLLQEVCVNSGDVIIPWQYGRPRSHGPQDTAKDRKLLLRRSDPWLLQVLKDCPDVDVFLPAGLRSHGYCEDGVVYTKCMRTLSLSLFSQPGLTSFAEYLDLKSRLLPGWVFTDVFEDPETGRSLSYYDICPRTPIIYFNHYWDNVVDASKDKPMYLMPNIEMYELRETHFWRADVVLCKTLACQSRVTQWYKQEGNPRNTQVFYTKHTTSDVAHFVRHRTTASDANAVVKSKDFENVRFVHTAGNSGWKGTREILRCWLSRADLPPLDLYIHKDNLDIMFDAETSGRILNSSNIDATLDRLDAVRFGRVMAESAFFLCPSVMEGYGHYINQARATGGVIITTDAEPMNELVPSTDMGVYVKTQVDYGDQTFLGGAFDGSHGLQDVGGLVGHFEPQDLCAAADQVVAMSVMERKVKAARIRQKFHEDTKFYAAAMEKLKEFARRTAEAAVVATDSQQIHSELNDDARDRSFQSQRLRKDRV